MSKLLCTTLLTLILLASSDAQISTLRDGFVRPPDSARPWVYWMWMDGNLTREGITADLESMKKAGIGGAIICEVNVGVPRGPVEFMSREWRQLFKHMVSEAQRLGLQITMNAGPGWTGSGGPWVRPEQSMQHIVASETTVTGPARFSGILSRPQRWPAFFGDGLLPPELEKVKNDFFIDVAVLAFPTPEGKPEINDIAEKALYVRAPYSSQPGVRATFNTPADFPSLPAGSTIPPDRVIDLTGRRGSDGMLVWDVPPGRWSIMRFGRTSTGATTRPAPFPGLGLECDKLDTASLNAHFEAFVGALLRDIGKHKGADESGWAFLHIDSWEMGAQNWTEAFREEFRSRRGYDLLPYLPSIAGRIVDSPEITERFLWDLRQTVQELILQNHAGHLKTLARRTGFGLSIEPYDMNPAADMSLGGIADVPMCEFWMYGFNTCYSVLEAASLAHTWGRPIVAAEAFTSSDEERWQAHPGNMKALGDWAFCAGVNRIAFHRFQAQPWSDRFPGMTMGPYGVHWDRTQTWWSMVPAYHKYLSRCQHLLRQGLPVADICYLVAEGAPHVFRPPSSATVGNPPDRREYNFDGCSPEALLELGTVTHGKLILANGMTYRVLVLPERETMTPRLLRKIRGLVHEGLTIIGPPPRKSPSLSGYPDCDAEVKKLAEELWGKCDGIQVTENVLGKGRVIWERIQASPSSEPEQYGEYGVIARQLCRMDVPPDFESDGPLRYTHRMVGEEHLYFLANKEGRPATVNCVFRASGSRIELWDPVQGVHQTYSGQSESGGRTKVRLHFEPHQSVFVMFLPPLRKNSDEIVASSEGTFNLNPADAKILVDLSRGWTVLFDEKRGGPRSATFDSLDDWSRRPELGIRYYSGTATYVRSFDLSSAVRKKSVGGRLWLDLGTVRELASVRMNGKDLGVVWCAPRRVEISGAVRPGSNQVEIVVANLWPNRLIGDEQLPPDCEFSAEGNLVRWPDWILKNEPRPSTGRYTFTTWKHFTKDSPLPPSGLLGPVRITD